MIRINVHNHFTLPNVCSKDTVVTSMRGRARVCRDAVRLVKAAGLATINWRTYYVCAGYTIFGVEFLIRYQAKLAARKEQNGQRQDFRSSEGVNEG